LSKYQHTSAEPRNLQHTDRDKEVTKINSQKKQDPSIINKSPGVVLQPKLTVGAPDDPYEKEADTVADKVMRMQEQNFVQRKCSHCEEEEKKQIHRKPLAAGILPMIQTKTESNSIGGSSLSNKILASKGGGNNMDTHTQSFMSSRFGADFTNIKIHTDGDSVQMNRELNAKAFTVGSDIYFNEGQYQPHSNSGKHLLAHELTHTVQQAGVLSKKIMRVVDEASVEAEFNKWAVAEKRVKDKTDKDYPWAVWDFIRPQIADASMEPLPKPKDKAGIKKWDDNIAKAEIISRWLFKIKATTADPDIKKETDDKAYNILDLFVRAGLVSKAIAQSGYLDKGTRTLVYDQALKDPSLIAASEFKTIVEFQCNGIADPASVTIVQKLTDGNNSPLKKLVADKSIAILEVLLRNYKDHATIIDAIAELLMFNPGIRNKVSDAMMSGTIGDKDILFKVLKHKFFIEPGYGGGAIAALIPPGMAVDDYEKKRMKDDMPWVYTYKQKYYVQYLIDLAASQSITITAPAKMDFAGLKKWLEANTENIGAAAKAKYKSNPKAVFEIYENIADIFFYHIPHERDAVPDLEGKISHLKEGEPAKKRFEADCDVFATYAMRLFFNAGFEPIGYLGFYPKGADAARAGHVAALIRKDGTYYVINNKGILQTSITETTTGAKKADAIKKMRKISFEDAYGDPRPKDMKIYYADAEAKGKMSKLFFDQDSSLERADLL
jgi:hypothetical protein